MEISDFHVYEGDEEREYLDEGRSWDSGRDLSQKAGRSGIVDKESDGVELCWGLGRLAMTERFSLGHDEAGQFWFS